MEYLIFFLIMEACAASGMIGTFTQWSKNGIPLGAGFVIGLCIMIYGQTKYNHGIF